MTCLIKLLLQQDITCKSVKSHKHCGWPKKINDIEVQETQCHWNSYCLSALAFMQGHHLI